jgi:death-on-curing protein
LHGGAQGIRDLNLLQSALARPRHLLAYGHEPQILTLAAAYAFGIVRNHPFADGNKRTGFLVSILFLELNGFRFIATEENAAQAIISLAAGTMTEDAFRQFLRDNTKPQS